MPLTPLQMRVAREILGYIRRERLQVGAHLPESILAQALGTSRSPVKTVLLYLAEQGIVARDLNRGFFVARAADDLVEFARHMMHDGEDPLYLKLAELRLANQLPEIVSEIDLMREFDVPRCAVRAMLSRMQQE